MKLQVKYIIIFILVLFLFAECNTDKKHITAKKGEINFTNYNFDTDGIVKLDGEWEFYPNKFLNNTEIQQESATSYLEIPSSWKDVEINNEKLKSFGYATYKLKIIPNKKDSMYSLSVSRIDLAYKLWINDKLILQAGQIAKNKKNYKPEWKSQTADFKINSDTLVLIMQIANYDHRKAGITSSIEISTPEHIENKDRNQLSYNFFLLGLLLIMAFYHVGLFALRKIDLSTIYFALLLFFVAIHHTVVGQYPIKFLFPNINWLFIVKADFIINYLRITSFALFLWFMFKKDINIWFIRIFLGISILMVLFILFTPPSIFTFTFIVFIIILLISFFYMLFGSFRATINKRDGAIYSLIGTLIALVVIINDWLHAALIINTTYLIPFGTVLFIFLQSFMISLRFSRAFKRTEKLSKDLENLTQTLEQKVTERTSEIEQQKKELHAQANNLIELNEQHQTTNEILIHNQNQLEATNEELNQQKEELSVQAENLKQANHAVIESKQILEEQHNQISIQNKKITDSIQYAKRIQKAIIPPPNTFDEYFQESFVLLEPKDIVSGDFYFFEKINETIVFAAADCTGHGVPGGFMSMLSMTLISEIIKKCNKLVASNVLNQLRKDIIISLKQNTDKIMISDGLDIAFCILDTKTKKMQFAGAYHPLVYINENNGNPEMNVIKGDRMPIGKYIGEDKSFTTKNIQLKKNDVIYIYTDGFQDQYSSKKTGKFLSRKFRELLFAIHKDIFADQKELLKSILKTNIDENNKINRQTDDVLVMGFKI